jgi:16S rRNA G966 N2-methylase RsmD
VAATVARLTPEKQTAVLGQSDKAAIKRAAASVRIEETAAKRAENAALKAATVAAAPSDRFNTIIIDPPWDMQKIERDVRPNQVAFDYPTMTEAELAAFPLAGMGA